MSETSSQDLSGVPETMLITLYLRAMESQRPDALIKDEKAVELVTRMSYDFERVRRIPMNEANRLVIILRNREFDHSARDFLKRHPEAVVVHIGCGLDARFERIGCNQPDIGLVEWYDLDLPEVIELRYKLFGDEGERHHLLGCSALDHAWLEAVKAPARLAEHRPRPFLFLAEGVFMYFQEAQVRSLVLMLRDRFPGAELVFDAFSPYIVWANNLRLSITKFGARYHWGLKRGQEIESWGAASPPGAAICLLDEWGFLDSPEPRLDHIRWMRHIPLFARVLRIYHYRLGEAAG